MLSRRFFVAGGLAVVTTAVVAQTGHPNHEAAYESLRQPGRIPLPPVAEQQRVFDSPAPKAANPGRWMARAPLPVPRSEMAWAAERDGKLHLVGGYGEQRVDRKYHQVYDPAADRWLEAAPLPRGANHVGVAVVEGRLYAIGGFVEQNRRPHEECFVFDFDQGGETGRPGRFADVAGPVTASTPPPSAPAPSSRRSRRSGPR